MRNSFILAAAIALGLAGVTVSAHAQMMGGYRGNYGMMGGYGDGYYGHGPGMMYGYGSGHGIGQGMMYGYGPDGERYYGHSGHRYRGKQLCWHQTGSDQDAGYYSKCGN